MHALPEDRRGHRAADDRRRDVVEECRQSRTPARAARGRPSSRPAGIAAAHRESPVSSKCRASSAKPSSSANRFTSTTHSCAKCAGSPARPVTRLKPRASAQEDHGGKAQQSDRQRVAMEDRDTQPASRRRSEFDGTLQQRMSAAVRFLAAPADGVDERAAALLDLVEPDARPGELEAQDAEADGNHDDGRARAARSSRRRPRAQ